MQTMEAAAPVVGLRGEGARPNDASYSSYHLPGINIPCYPTSLTKIEVHLAPFNVAAILRSSKVSINLLDVTAYNLCMTYCNVMHGDQEHHVFKEQSMGLSNTI